MDWASGIKGFTVYLRLERGASPNTLAAYRSDLEMLAREAETHGWSPLTATSDDLRAALEACAQSGRSARTQARYRSAIRQFYRYIALEGLRTDDPTDGLRAPRLPQKLPVYLTTEEVDRMAAAIDRSRLTGERNLAILETLFGSGLRVSELVGLRLRDVHVDDGLLRVLGKGNKERLVPLTDVAGRAIHRYVHEVRVHQKPAKGSEDHVFLNVRGGKLSRVMVFLVLRELAALAGIKKTIGPHTLRHSFATALVQNGADLRAVQLLLGHESITTTEIYAHLEDKHLRQTLEHFHPWSAGRVQKG